MLRDNLNFNQDVTPNSAFLDNLRSKLPEFFTSDRYNEEGELIEKGSFDLTKFQQSLKENNINELTSGYRLDFIGKDYAKKQAGEKPTTVILPDREHNNKPENKDSQNLFLTGDNLEVLRHLQTSYENEIDVIYIDPPYNTGSDGFVYPDKFEYSDDNLQAMFGLTDEELKRLKSIQGRASHSAWLTFMYPRLWLAKRLLNDSGVIFVSIDDNEQANLKLLMDEIFGEGSFCGQYIWKRTDTPANLSKTIKQSTEFVLSYKKNEIERFYGIQKTSLSSNGLMNQSNSIHELVFPENIVDTGLKDGIYKAGKYGTSSYEIELLDDTEVIDNIFVKPVHLKGRFKWGQEYLENEISKGTKISIRTAAFSPSYERTEYDKEVPPSLIDRSVGVSTNESAQSDLDDLLGRPKMFSNPKPTSLVQYLINFLENNNSLILDFFAGSGTTADAVMQLNAQDGGNRRYIMVQLPEPTFSTNSDGTEVARSGSETAFQAGYRTIDEISRQRIELASKKIQAEKDLTNFDGGFKHYRVVTPIQTTLDDLDNFDVADEKQLNLLEELDFSDMVTPFSSEKLGYNEGASGQETILSTWLLADGYGFDSEVIIKNFAGYQAPYLSANRLYLIETGWTSDQTKALLNAIGKNDLTLQTLVIYAYSFSLENLRELELALNQLDTKINLIKRY